MRIVSLLPSTTEMVYALGLGDSLVGVTHECDYPPEASAKPVVTASTIGHQGTSAAEIDAAVSASLRDGLSLYSLDAVLLDEIHPDLILTQELCDVCAVAYSEVRRVARDLGGQPRVVSFEPTSLAEVLACIGDLGRIVSQETRAGSVVAELQARIERVREQARGVARRPRVALLEWIDPPFGPGHWVPEMIEFAGGIAGLGTAGAPSRRISWGDVIAFAPEVIVVACCGMNLPHALGEAQALLPSRTGWEALPAVRRGQVYVIDANAYCSRPGPRLVDSLELLAELIHPDRFAGWAPPNSFVQF